MKTFLLAAFATTLLTTTSAFAQYGPGYPPAQRGRDFQDGYYQDRRPDFRDRDRWGDGRQNAPRYNQQQAYGYNQQPAYGYDQSYGYNQPVFQPQPPRRPVAVSIQVQL